MSKIELCCKELDMMWRQELTAYSEHLERMRPIRKKKMLRRAAVSGFLNGFMSLGCWGENIRAGAIDKDIDRIKKDMLREIDDESEEFWSSICQKEQTILLRYGFHNREDFFKALDQKQNTGEYNDER